MVTASLMGVWWWWLYGGGGLVQFRVMARFLSAEEGGRAVRVGNLGTRNNVKRGEYYSLLVGFSCLKLWHACMYVCIQSVRVLVERRLQCMLQAAAVGVRDTDDAM